MNTNNQILKSKTFQKDYEEIWTQLNTVLTEKNIPVFTVVDHQKNAQNVNLNMPKTRVLIFGNPLVGTPLMLDTPDIALELPLKFLVREDNGMTIVAWNDPHALAEQYNTGKQGLAIAEKMSMLMENIVNGIY